MGTLAQMRHLSALTVEATLDGPTPDLSTVPGVTAVEADGRVVRCQVRGSVEPLLTIPRPPVSVGCEPRAVARGTVPGPIRRGRSAGGYSQPCPLS